MKDAEKEYFGSLPLPSPRIVTTRADPGRNSPYMEFSFNNGHKLTLFSDPGFFKFCTLSIFELDEERNKRMLNNKTAKELMENTSNFTILDYQLKTLQRGPFAGSPLGLFLIEEPGNPKSAVCAHLHFAKDDTSRVGRINLAHHLTPPRNEMLYVEGLHGLSKSEVRKRKHVIEYVAVPNVSQPCDREPDDLEY